MKIKKTKLQRKNLQFYAVNYGLRPPYRVLAEPEFLQTAIDNKVFLRDDLPKLLHDTSYLVHDLGEKGEKFSGSAIMAKRLFREKCTHEEAVSSQQCIKDVIGGGFQCVVGAQTEDLKKDLRNIAGVPVVTVSERNHNLVLEAPSKASQYQANKNSHYKSLKISPEEAAMIEEAKKELAQGQPIPPPPKKRKRPIFKKKKSKDESEQSNTNNENNENQPEKKKTRRKKKNKTTNNNNVQESSTNE